MILNSYKTAAILIGLSITVTACGNDKPTTSPNKSDHIAFYAKENATKAQRQLDMQTNMVAIIQHGNWIKVGLRPSGDIGWIDLKQYQQAQQNYYRPQTQSFSVSITRNKDGKPTTQITAYRNGKKLSNKEAKQQYQHLQQEQPPAWGPWVKNEHNMQTMMTESFNRLNNAYPRMNITIEEIPSLKPLNLPPKGYMANEPSSAAIHELMGQYTDPNHPLGTRTITVASNEITIVGRDTKIGPEWTVHGVMLGDTVLVDFSSKGGPKGLKGTFDSTGITFEDGNKWQKQQTSRA